jgi:hypothetical protein
VALAQPRPGAGAGRRVAARRWGAGTVVRRQDAGAVAGHGRGMTAAGRMRSNGSWAHTAAM